MTVRTTATAEAQIAAIDQWWRENRPKAPDLFLDELEDAFALIEAAPTLAGRGLRLESPVCAG